MSVYECRYTMCKCELRYVCYKSGAIYTIPSTQGIDAILSNSHIVKKATLSRHPQPLSRIVDVKSHLLALLPSHQFDNERKKEILPSRDRQVLDWQVAWHLKFSLSPVHFRPARKWQSEDVHLEPKVRWHGGLVGCVGEAF